MLSSFLTQPRYLTPAQRLIEAHIVWDNHQ